MKTRIIITAAAILFSITLANASSKERSLAFRDALGRTFTIPLMEEKDDTVPFDTRAVFNSIRSNMANQVFDISNMSKPEQEEALPFDPKEVLKNIR